MSDALMVAVGVAGGIALCGIIMAVTIFFDGMIDP